MARRMTVLISSLLMAGWLTGCYRTLHVSPTTFAPPSPPPTRQVHKTTHTITPHNLVPLLLQRNVRIRSLRASHALHKQSYTRVKVVENPELRVSRLSTALPEAGAGGLTLQLRWRPPFPSEVTAKQSQAKAQSRMYYHKTRQTIATLIAAAQGLYAQLAANKREQTTQTKLQTLHRKRWKLAQTRSKIGATTVLKAELAKLAFQQAKQRLRTLKRKRMQYLGTLANALRFSHPTEPHTPDHWLATLPSLSSLTKFTTQAIKHSPALHQLVAKQQITHASLWLANRKRIPWFSFVQLSYDFDKENLPNRFFLSIGIDLPLFNWNTGNIQAEQQTFRYIQQQIKTTRRTIARQVRHAYQQLIVLKQDVTQQKYTIQQHIKTSLARAAKAKTIKGTNRLEVIEVELYTARFQRTYTRTLLQFHQQYIHLQRMTSAHTPVQ